MRFLIAIGLLYLVYRILKSWIFQKEVPYRTASNQEIGPADDELIQDPYCKIYFPKREGVNIRWNGRDLSFCSHDCKERFLSSQSGDNR